MKKEEQNLINRYCNVEWEDAMEELQCMSYNNCERLRTCQAWVYETPHYFVLRSYNSFIACINKDEDCLIDMLRSVYGYTATSAKHISKFSKDYGKGKWGVKHIEVYRDI